jgi:Protein of unknown function (DUF1571)
MFVGKDAFRLALLLTAALLGWGCQNSPDSRPAARVRPLPNPNPDGPAEGSVRAAAPLRITEPPSALAQGPTAAQGGSLPTLPDLPTPGATPIVAQPTSAPAVPGESDLHRIHRLAAEKYAGMDGYIVRLTRREQVNGKDQPKEVIKLSFRKDPWSVHFVWLEGETKGREAVHVKGRYDDKLHTLLGPNDGNLLYRAGSHIALAPDSALVRSSSRHVITEAGVGNLIDRFGSLVVANDKGDTRGGTLTYRGRQKRPEFADPVETIEQVVPAGADKDLPRGGRRLWVFDASANHLPALLTTTDDRGHEVEYYLYDRYVGPIRFEDKEFDPDALWGKP